MRCPFLREEQVKSCRAAPFRKALARSALRGVDERCTTAGHVGCPVVLQSREAHPAPSRCPFLHESLVQFCAAAPIPTYVPWTESPEVRCCHDGHRFCELYLGMAGASGRGPARAPEDPAESRTADVEGIAMPGWLFYAPNHLWLDVGDDGLLHLGIDAFLTRLVGSVERLTFLTPKGDARPAVVVRVAGADLTLRFPRPLPIVAANTRLRSSLERLTADPNGLGWLFEVRAPGGPGALLAGLAKGEAARSWMRREVRRVSEFVHRRVVPRTALGTLSADGGLLAPGLTQDLDREDVLLLFAELFPSSTDTGGIA
jgi:glycine cleavage system H lipoate-binding protein